MNLLRHLCLPLLMTGLSLPLVAAAQKAAPAAGRAAPSEEPAIQTENQGTTIVGDRESPIGLYITPWREAAPEAELDRPARFLEEELLPIDSDVFHRQIEYYSTITSHLGGRGPIAAPKAK